MLEIKDVYKRFGGLHVLEAVSMNIAEGSIAGLIGPNGAGKTTLFNVVMNLLRIDRGDIRFQDKSLLGMKTHEIARLGIGRTFQLVKPFANLSVLKNVMVGALIREESLKSAKEIAMETIDFLELSEKANTLAKSMTLADRKRLEIAKVLAAKPKLLLLDEVMAGLNPIEVREVIALIRKIFDSGVTIFIIEHVMSAIMNLCDTVTVINQGRRIATGRPADVVKDREVIKAYLGEEYGHTPHE